MTRRATTALLALLLLLAPVAVGCSGSDEGSSGDGASAAGASGFAPGAESAAQALAQERIVIDVRTPEEYAQGHVEDATLIDVQDDSFDEQIAALDASGAYVVYCRSGNRSAVAAERMRDAGLDVLDGGGFETMTDAGWPAA